MKLTARIPSFIKSYILDFANIKMHQGRFVAKLDLYKYEAIKTLVLLQSNAMKRSCDCEQFTIVAAIRNMVNIRILSFVVTYADQEKTVAIKYSICGNISRQFIMQ